MNLNFSIRVPPAVRDFADDTHDFVVRTVTDVRNELRPVDFDGLFERIGSDAEDTFGDAARWTADRLRDVLGSDAAEEIAQWLRDLPDLDLRGVERLLHTLPERLRGPDDTGEVPTGASDIGREDLVVYATLGAVPRMIAALGPEEVTGAEVQGESFAVVRFYDDPVTGFAGAHLRSLTDGRDVFALDGLQVGSLADTVAALDLGRPQANSPAFAELVADAQNAALLEGREIVFTGPSLGGALAQVAAYEAAEGLVASGLPFGPGAVTLVTVDPLGGRDAAESLNGGALDPTALALINAVNLRTEGDIVSRIGSHIGQTITFDPVDRDGNPVQVDVQQAHVNVESLLATLSSDELFAAGERGAPAEIGGFALASNLAGPVVTEAYLRSGVRDDPDVMASLQLPGTFGFDETGTRYLLDANEDGAIDLALTFAEPQPGTAIAAAPSSELQLLG